MILEIELSLYKRLSLNNIRYFKLTMKEIVQIILGTNGSGKSAILHEMSPMPANNKNYYKGGKKRILYNHNGKLYELISDFTNGQDHYFWCDGENLNIGRTVTVQKELVKEHFGVTAETHELLLGEEKFTQMSAARRRELFMRLCVVDYTYAVKLYKRIQEELVTYTKGIKLARQRLVEETIKTVKPEELESMRQRLSVLTRQSQEMYLVRNAQAHSVSTSKSNLERSVAAIYELTNKFKQVRKALGTKAYISPDEFQTDIEYAKTELAGIESLYARLSEEFINLSSDIGNSDELLDENVVELKEKVISNNNQIKVLLERRKQPLEGLKPYAASGSMELVYESLVSVLTSIPADPDNKLNSGALVEVEERLKLLAMSLSSNKTKLASIEHREQHYQELANSNSLVCPECTHEWKAGYDAELHKALKQRIEQGRSIVGTLEMQIKEATTEHNALVEYANLYKEYIRITRNTPELQPLWLLVDEHRSIKVSPQHVLTLVELVRSDLMIELQAEAIREKIKTDLQRLQLVEYAQSASVKEKKVKQERLENELGLLSSRRVLLQKSLNDTVLGQRQVLSMYDLGDKVRAAKDALQKSSFDVIESIKNEVIDNSLQDTHSEIATLSSRINSIDQHASILESIKNTITEYEEEAAACTALSEALSPTDGLIAQGMLGFIRNYVARMNALIAKVWTYRMVVHDCSTEEESAELNYKFPLSTPNLPEPVPDVSNGSAGQKEMIDLAWRVISAQCLKLDYGPLFLDEFGKTFDEAHQSIATQVISQLMEQLNFTQLFMISHYEACYGAFYNAQLTVLDKRNITVPSHRRFNEHVEMTT